MDRKLTAFLAVARVGNVTQAADRIGLTQPALTKTIRRLEVELGARLFERTARGMVLTDMGELFMRHARAIEGHWSQAREEAHARSDGTLTELRIAAGSAYHLRIVPQLIRTLSVEYPETRFVLDVDVAATSVPRLLSGEIHLLLGAFVHEVPEGLVTEKLLDVVSWPICCRDDPLARLDPVGPEALRARRWVIYRRDTLMRERLTEYFLRFQMPLPQVVMEVDALASTFQAIAGTPYLTAAPMTIVPMAEQSGLKLVPVDPPLWSFPSGAWTRRATTEYPIIRRALEILRILCKSHSAELSPVPGEVISR